MGMIWPMPHEHVIDIDNIPKMTLRQKLVLIIFVLGIIFTVHGVIVNGYYIDELSAVFLCDWYPGRHSRRTPSR